MEVTMKQAVVVGVPLPTLAVIGVGLGRTGTLSVHAALERLGSLPASA